MTTDRSRRVILLIDYDNLQICASRDAPGTELDLQAVLERAQSYGTVVTARAYAEWNMPSERLGVYKAGIEPIFAPVLRTESRGRIEGKSLCDTVMVVEGVDLLWTVQPDVLVLVTSDKDLIPLARVARQRGAWVVVIGSDLTAVQLVEMCNELVTYKQVLKELGKEPATALPGPSRSRSDRGRPVMAQPQPVRTPRPPRDPVVPPPPPLPMDVADSDSLATDDLPDALGEDGDGAAAPARRRRRRRGTRTRTDEGLPDGAEVPAEDATNGEVEGNGRAETAAADLAPIESVAMPEVNGDLAPAEADPASASTSDVAAEAEAPARPRRRRRTTTTTRATAETPAEAPEATT